MDSNAEHQRRPLIKSQMAASPWTPICIRVCGEELRLFLPHTDDHIQKTIRRTKHLYEEEVLFDCLGRDLPAGTIIDVGANIGNHTLFFARILKRKVIALEPFSTTFSVLRENVALNGLEEQVDLVAKAAGSVAGRARLKLPKADNLGKARIVIAAKGDIEVVCLDDLTLSDPVALIKVDVEGMELDVLQGARQLLERHRPMLLVEAGKPGLYAQLKRWLRPLGYEMLRRFNYTPTYAFVACSTQEDCVRTLLEKTDSLNAIEDVKIAQQESTNRWKTQHVELARKISELRVPLVDLRDSQQQMVEEIEGHLDSQYQELHSRLSSQEDAARQSANVLHEFAGTVIPQLQAGLQTFLAAHVQQSADALEHRVVQRIEQLLARSTRPAGAPESTPGVLQLPVQVGGVRVVLAVPVPGSKVTNAQTGSQFSLSNGSTHAGTCSIAATSLTAHPERPQPVGISWPTTNRPHGERVSLIMTTYNSAGFVGDSIQSILHQTHRDLELIVVDDGSTDDTFVVLQQFARQDPRVRPIKAFQNRGTYWCKNLGLTHATGDYVTFQDSDDCSDPRRLEIQLRELRSHPHAVMCTCNYIRVDQNGAVANNRGKSERRAIMAPLFCRAAVLQHVGYFDSVRTSADDEFLKRVRLVFGAGGICHVAAPLYIAKVREGSLTNCSATRADLNSKPSGGSELAFLSAPRREYIRQFSLWHEAICKGLECPLLSFPLVRRRFPAPSLLLPLRERREDFVSASLASMPQRRELLQRAVASILGQVDALNVYLNGFDDTPQFLLHPKIHVVHSRDYSDLRDNGKFFFADSLLWGYHLTIDDDIVYPPDYVQRQILKIEQYDRRAIIGCHGVILADPMTRFMQGRQVFHFNREQRHDRFVNLLGTGTTAYHISTIRISLSDFPLPGMADLWFAAAAKRQGVPMISIQRPKKWLVPLMEADETSLYKEAIRDDHVQTEIAQGERPWNLDHLCSSYSLVDHLLNNFSNDELRSRDVDPRILSLTGTEIEARMLHDRMTTAAGNGKR